SRGIAGSGSLASVTVIMTDLQRTPKEYAVGFSYSSTRQLCELQFTQVFVFGVVAEASTPKTNTAMNFSKSLV
uniref:hypothetical protein n=1 Tax=uncultured Gimesia sp. TaxID=1678688 RepID=UPI002623108E